MYVWASNVRLGKLKKNTAPVRVRIPILEFDAQDHSHANRTKNDTRKTSCAHRRIFHRNQNPDNIDTDT